MPNDSTGLGCPFCDYTTDDEYRMLLHVEIQHSENGDSPFAVKDEVAAAQQLAEEQEQSRPARINRTIHPETCEYVPCPYQCGELIPAHDMHYHTDFHVAAEMADADPAIINITSAFSTDIDSALRRDDQTVSQLQTPTRRKWTSSLKELFSSSRRKPYFTATTPHRKEVGKIQRLGKTELGPYAHEKRMPSWLIDMLERGPEITKSNRIGHDGQIVKVEIISNETPNLVPVLARLSWLDKNVARAVYCDRAVRHVAKMAKEGGFCGYRNIQMLISYIRDAKAPGHEQFKHRRLPGVLKLQDMIEDAWRQGYNDAGRDETGGIRLTRKYIGTPEAQALLLSLDIPAEAIAVADESEEDAYMTMMEIVCRHFDDGCNLDDKVVITDKPPLYFQHQGHSLTVVGVEVDLAGRANLVVFDPMYIPIPRLRELAINNKLVFSTAMPEKLMKAYRRDDKYLGRYKAFEMIKVNGPV